MNEAMKMLHVRNLGMGILLGLLAVLPAAAGSGELTYQGRLIEAGVPFDGTISMEFRLYSASVGGTQIGPKRGHGPSQENQR